MQGNSQRPSVIDPAESASSGRETIEAAASFLQRLIPFPGGDVVPTLSPLGVPAQNESRPSISATVVSDVVGEQASSIVAQAASVLDDEMAKGVLTARRSGGSVPQRSANASNPVLRQLLELVDNIATLWPSPQTAAVRRFAGFDAAASEADALAELRPAGTSVRPGQRATISMTLRNNENRAVRLIPAATDLLGSRGGRIGCSLLEFMPSELGLEPQQQSDLVIAVTVPVDAVAGCYSGLLVVRGLDYLRALITIDVA
jgi:hypothetical protein